jgi:hypothetical protein
MASTPLCQSRWRGLLCSWSNTKSLRITGDDFRVRRGMNQRVRFASRESVLGRIAAGGFAGGSARVEASDSDWRSEILLSMGVSVALVDRSVENYRCV